MKFNIIDKFIDDVNLLNDHTWCMNNVDWSCTNDIPPTRYNDGYKHTWFCYNEDKNIIEQITFFYVIVHSAHGSAGTSFYRHYYLGEKLVGFYSKYVYPTFEECKQNIIDDKNREINGYEYAIKIRKDIIDKVNELKHPL